MRFKAYVLKVKKNGEYRSIDMIDPENVVHNLMKIGRMEDEDDTYSPMYIKRKESLILGTLVQSYVADLKTFSDVNTDEEVNIVEDRVNDRVFFYIDLDENIVYVQNKRYPAKELKHEKTVSRIQKIIEKCLDKSNLVLLPVTINYTLSEIDNIFMESNVREIHFSNLAGIEVPAGSAIHNPKREWDDTFAKSWNKYAKDDLDSIDLKAVKGRTLTKNPIARLCLILASVGNPNEKKVFKGMTVISNGEREEIKLEGNENKVINISKEKQEDSYEAYDCIIKKKYPGYKGRLEE